MTRPHSLRSLVLAALAAVACQSQPAPPAPPAEPKPPANPMQTPAHVGVPSLADAAHATYNGLEIGTITLEDGVWQREPSSQGGPASVMLARDFSLTGDLNGDGQPELVVLLTTNMGGTGTQGYFAVLRRRLGGVANVATGAIGDRVQIVDATIANGQIVATVVRAGKHDAMCCPSEKARLTFTLRNQELARTGDDTIGKASLDDIGGGEWVLSRFTWDEAAPAEPAVTLQLKDGNLVGRSGCNRYTAPIKAGDSPGAISIGPAAGTRMACPGPAAAVEQRFLEALGAVNHYGFIAGQLALGYTKDGALQTMLFRRIG